MSHRIIHTSVDFLFPFLSMSKTVILEPIDFESEAEENKLKAKWRKIHI